MVPLYARCVLRSVQPKLLVSFLLVRVSSFRPNDIGCDFASVAQPISDPPRLLSTEARRPKIILRSFRAALNFTVEKRETLNGSV